MKRHVLSYSEVKSKVESRGFEFLTLPTDFINTNHSLEVKCPVCSSLCVVMLRNFMRAQLGCNACAIKLRHTVARGKVSKDWQRLRRIFYKMNQRCYNKKNKQFSDYGGRGITICEEWLTSLDSFYQWSMQNGYSEKLMIDRIDNNEGYAPNNCRWTTSHVQNNNRRNNLVIEFNGQSKTISQWSIGLGVSASHLRERFHAGLRPPELFAPAKKAITIEYNNKMQSLNQWCIELGLCLETIRYRYHRGMRPPSLFAGKL